MYDFECPVGHRFERNVRMADRDAPVQCEEPDGTVHCGLAATRVEIAFSPSNAILDHGLGANRDAAREGRYDPANPTRRFMAKGRTWQRSK